MKLSSRKIGRFFASPRKKKGYEFIEDALMLIVGTSPTNPLPSKRRADFLDLLALANRARESGNWPVKHTNVSGRCCVDMDECRSWAEGVKPDLGRADLKDEVLRLERHALDVLRQRGLQVDSGRVSISRSGNDADRRQLLFYATQIESSPETTAEEKSAAQTLQELPELWDEIESKHPSRRSLAARLSVLQERRLEGTRQELEKTRPDAERGEKVLKGVLHAHEIAHGTTEEKKERWQRFEDECIKVHHENPQWGLTKIRQKVADRAVCSLKNIERHTKNLRNLINRPS